MSPNPQRLWTPVPWWPNRTPGRVWLPGNQSYVSEQPPQRRRSSICLPGKSACGSCCHYPNHWTCPLWILLYPSVFLILLNAVVQCFCELKIYLYPQSIFFNKKSEDFKHWYQTCQTDTSVCSLFWLGAMFCGLWCLGPWDTVSTWCPPFPSCLVTKRRSCRNSQR